MEIAPSVKSVEMDLTQGRWQENVMKKVSSYSNQQFSIPFYSYREAGLSIKYATHDGQIEASINEKLFAMLSSLFSIAVFEYRNEHITLKDGLGQSYFYFSKPYEPFCKENLSFILKFLSSIGYGGGLHKLISDSQLHSSLYKHFNFRLIHEQNGPLGV